MRLKITQSGHTRLMTLAKFDEGPSMETEVLRRFWVCRSNCYAIMNKDVGLLSLIATYKEWDILSKKTKQDIL